MNERNVPTFAALVCVIGLLLSLWDTNLLGATGFGMGIIGFMSSRWFFVRWERAGKPENNNSFL